MLINIFTTGLIIYEICKDPINLEEANLLTIKFLSYYFIFLRTVLVLPMVLAFACFASPSIYGLSLSGQIILGIVSGIGLLFLLINSVINVLLYRDNSPFSKL